MLLSVVDLTAASEKGNLVAVAIVLGRPSNVVFHAPHLVEGRPLIKIVDEDDLTTIDLHAMPSKSVDDEECLVRVRFDSLGENFSRFEDSLVSWSVFEEILAISAIVRNCIFGYHNSYFFDVCPTLQKLIDTVLYLDTSPLVLVSNDVHLSLDHSPGGIVGSGGVADEARVVGNVWVVLDFIFERLRLHLCLKSFSRLIYY